uniref:UBIQUITIN_CONJUGAT_2 domain-containing protein n=1 Tax=Steinernema glaseri TaxID=37863 RepID=A0A1I8AIS3_9BILA
MAMFRIKAELKNFVEHPPANMQLDTERTAEDAMTWYVNVKAAEGTIYEGEEYVVFVSEQVPCNPHVYSNGHICISTLGEEWSPALDVQGVVFVSEQVPCNPHVYSNGHICISTLGEEWSPALDVQGVCVGILSMLSSCKEKEWPAGNDDYSKSMKDRSPDYRYFDGTYTDGAC